VALLTALLLVLGLFPASMAFADESDPALVDGYYQLSTADDLLWFSQLVNGGNVTANAKLLEDIDMTGQTWTPIGNGTPTVAPSYAGTFDGNGKSITYTYVTPSQRYGGAFGVIAATGIVEGLTVNGSLSGSGARLGGVAGQSAGQILDCVSNVTVTAPNGYSGGIVGYLSDGASLTPAPTVSACINNGSVTGGSNVGGLVGYMNRGNVLTDSLNTGAVTGTYSVGGAFGGVMANNTAVMTVTRVVNTGSVTGTSWGSTSYGVGGIGSEIDPFTSITYCVNLGDVTGPLGGGVGGIVGTAGGAGNALSYNYNGGTVTGDGDRNGTRVGGILGGKIYQGAIPMQHNYNTGAILYEGTGTDALLGPIVGTFPSSALPSVSDNYYAWDSIPDGLSVTIGEAVPSENLEAVSSLLQDILDQTTGESVVITPGGYPVPESLYTPPQAASYAVTIDDAISNGSLAVDTDEAEEDDVVTITVIPDENYQLVEGSLKANDGAIELAAGEIEGSYTFTMPAEAVLITAAFEEIPVSEPAIDISWYNTTDTEFTLTTKAQFLGFAAIVNNKPAVSAVGAVTGIDPTIPADDFKGRTVILAVDIDLGGIEVSPAAMDNTTAPAVWTEPVWEGDEWVPIGFYSSSGGNGNGVTGRPFKGTFDGGYHIISNLYVPYYGSSDDSDEGNSHGLFGDLGQGATVKNVVIVSGVVKGARFNGAIVGRNWGTVENCASYATVYGNGRGGAGGITGVNYNNGSVPRVTNCVSYGLVYNPKTSTAGSPSAGGITSTNEGYITNCLFVGKVGTGGITSYGGITTGNVTATYVINSYYLDTSRVPANTNPTPKTEAEIRTAAFVALLNGTGEAFNYDSGNVNGGWPLLAGMGGTPYVEPVVLDAPELSAEGATVTATSVALAPPSASVQDAGAVIEYRSFLTEGEYGAWQASPVFEGLEPLTTYYFQARYVAADTEGFLDSAASAAVEIHTPLRTGAPASGDLDGDGVVTITEVLLLVQYLTSGVELSPEQTLAMDLDNDGVLTMTDALLAIQLAMGN
jgi:hypothetical protein